MRYLYQQLIAFFVVILVILMTIGVAFTQMTRQTLQERNYEQLMGYASSVAKISQISDSDYLQQNMTRDGYLQYSLQLAENILSNQDISFAFFKSPDEVLYPLDAANNVDFTISDSDWSSLQSGARLQMTASTDLSGEKELTSYVLIPFSVNRTEFYGVMVVSQSASSILNLVSAFNQNLFKVFVISIIVSLLISYLFATFQVRRINRMKRATKEITNGNFDIELPVHNRDEFDELAEDFNTMSHSLKESQEEIERQEERRRQFMADASHEMRTPLTTINGLLEGLEYNAIPENQKDNAIRLMKNETNRLIRLVNENLDYEKIRTNQISMVIKKFNATATIENLLTQLESKAELARDVLILDTKEPIDVYADYDRFVQVLVNILQNAIQFTEDGEVHVGIEKGYLETIIEIRDTGIGMSEEQVKNIWDRYYKVDPSRKNKQFGESGLGLSIVEQLVRLHKGKIAVESELGVGTTFRISFPDVDLEEA
ncbi:HAMP domain-containing sensor histidine kinase [Enterococcus sp.]|uniref:HAMP domain-containing sensor histidine kinase n=1 Tax=Enterococcus sp. TaxID=35783 RepID=UPI000ED1ECF1|nr:HAMP domain-containing sensor histidine kinase [Enterococcus sp.]HCE13276.1 two-component sensor histidine kinase [Enterococcus sp.]